MKNGSPQLTAITPSCKRILMKRCEEKRNLIQYRMSILNFVNGPVSIICKNLPSIKFPSRTFQKKRTLIMQDDNGSITRSASQHKSSKIERSERDTIHWKTDRNNLQLSYRNFRVPVSFTRCFMQIFMQNVPLVSFLSPDNHFFIVSTRSQNGSIKRICPTHLPYCVIVPERT